MLCFSSGGCCVHGACLGGVCRMRLVLAPEAPALGAQPRRATRRGSHGAPAHRAAPHATSPCPPVGRLAAAPPALRMAVRHAQRWRAGTSASHVCRRPCASCAWRRPRCTRAGPSSGGARRTPGCGAPPWPPMRPRPLPAHVSGSGSKRRWTGQRRWTRLPTASTGAGSSCGMSRRAG